MGKLIAGNWKMNGFSENMHTIRNIAQHTDQATCDVLLCLPTTLLFLATQEIGQKTKLRIGAQDCHYADTGAHTGDISACMLKDAGASSIIIGHSERRQNHHETNKDISNKLKAVWAQGLQAVVCIGETEEQYQSGKTHDVLFEQLDNSLFDKLEGETVIAYEPVWAIGTGRTPTLDEIYKTHTAINTYMMDRFNQSVHILYGGSVKPENAQDIFGIDNVSGALVGGASLKAEDFCAIIDAAS